MKDNYSTAKNVALISLAALTSYLPMQARAGDEKSLSQRGIEYLDSHSDISKINSYDQNETPIATIQIAANSERGRGSSGLEGKATLNVTQAKESVEQKGLWSTVKSIGVVLTSPFRPTQWKDHPYRTTAVTVGYVGVIAMAAGGSGGGSSSTPVVQQPTATKPAPSRDEPAQTTTTAEPTPAAPSTPSAPSAPSGGSESGGGF